LCGGLEKFAWHLPLNRQTQMLAGQGVRLDRSTLVHWVGVPPAVLGFYTVAYCTQCYG
jgi:transposase